MKEREYGIEEKMAGLFTPDTLLPSQFFDRVRRRSELDGERRLMIAVLEDALDVFRKQVGARDVRSQQLFHEAEDWLEDREANDLFSFENICDVLDLNADYIRRGLHALKAKLAARPRGEVVTLHAEAPPEMRKASGD
jgi:hypothetical protein